MQRNGERLSSVRESKELSLNRTYLVARVSQSCLLEEIPRVWEIWSHLG